MTKCNHDYDIIYTDLMYFNDEIVLIESICSRCKNLKDEFMSYETMEIVL